MSSSRAPKWSEVKRSLAHADRAALLALIHELFDLSPGNAAFLAAKVAPQPSSALLKPFKRRVIDPFYPRGAGFGGLKFDDARRAIREYEKATADLPGVLDLMLTFVENGNRFTHDYGDIDERFYTSLESMMDQFLKRLDTTEGRGHFPEFEDRLERLLQKSGGLGWGYSDYMAEVLEGALRKFREQRPAYGA